MLEPSRVDGFPFLEGEIMERFETVAFWVVGLVAVYFLWQLSILV